MPKARNYSGEVWGRLTILSKVDGQKWLMKCECGTIKAIRVSHVRWGKTRSCGCLHLDNCKAGISRLKHGDAKKGKVKRLHTMWRGILNRCVNHPRYGKRGIKVCDEWKAYETFREWAYKNGYEDDLTIERINNNGDYEPSNCKFITMAEQTRNRRTSVRYTKDNRTMCQAEWARELGMTPKQVKKYFTEMHFEAGKK